MSDCTHRVWSVARLVIFVLALAACDGEMRHRNARWDGLDDAARVAQAAVNRASQIATRALLVRVEPEIDPGAWYADAIRSATRGPGGIGATKRAELGPGPFWDADSLAAAVVASVRTAVVAQANAQDAWAGRDTVDSAVTAEMFRLANAAWENTVDAAEASATAWDALSSDIGAVDPASLSATGAAVEEFLAAYQAATAAGEAYWAAWEPVPESRDSALLAVYDAVYAATIEYPSILPSEAVDSAWAALVDLVGDWEALQAMQGKGRAAAIWRAIRTLEGLPRQAVNTATAAVLDAAESSADSALVASYEAADRVNDVAIARLDAADAPLDNSKSRELTVLAAMAAREAVAAAHAAAEVWAAVSTSFRPPES